MQTAEKQVVLMILDGWGIGTEQANAILEASTPNMDKILAAYPHSQLVCSGEAVGLPEGQQGNSEVGHLNLGAGRVVYQELTRINKAVREKTLADNKVLQDTVQYCLTKAKPLHLMGLVSPGGVHSHSDHLLALIEMAKDAGLTEVYVHCFLDGRDVGPKTAAGYLEELEQKLQEIGVGKIATVSGRYYAMDRDNRWERVEKAYRAMTEGIGEIKTDAVIAVTDSYAAEGTDEFVLPTVICPDGQTPVAKVEAGDGLIFFNFRGDRAREISKAFVQPDFDAFPREYLDLKYVAMTQYEEGLNMEVAFLPQELNNTLGEVLAKQGVKQFRTAETEKYAHVTFFFNGGVEEPNPLEERVLVPSPKVATYDLQPEMSALAVKDEVLAALDNGDYPFILVNFANTDMVGHTGVMEAAKKAAETVDTCVGEIAEKVLAKDGVLLITADHGNAETMVDPVKGTPFTSHTSNPVPFIAVGKETTAVLNGALEDVAPTVLALLGIAQPAEMTGKNLLQK